MRAGLLLACFLAPACAGQETAGPADASPRDGISLPDGVYRETCPGTYRIDGAGDLPDVAHCQVIGGLDIHGAGMLHASLPLLEQVTNLWITGELTLDLPALTFVDAADISTSTLTDLQGLRNLTTVNTLRIASNPDLATLAGLENLSTVHTLSIYDNGLTSLAALDGVTSLNEMAIYENNLTALDGFNGLGHVGWTISIESESLIRVGGFDALTSVGNLSIRGPAITQLDAFDNLTTVTFDLQLELPAVRAVPELSGVTSAGGIRISNTGLADLSDLAGITLVPDGTLWIAYNPDLTALAPFDGITSARWVGVRMNPVLTDLGLTSLGTLVGASPELEITGNGMLDYCQILPLLTRLEMNGYTGPSVISGNFTDSCP
jgi:hypothetical protein